MQAPVEALHGALCPANVVVGKDGVTRVVHLFRPRPPRVGADSEALAYAAPEVLDGDTSIDARCDVYALGAILWEAIVGRPPHEHADPAAILLAQREGELARPTLTPGSPWTALLDVAMSALRFDAGLRPRSATALASDIRSAVGDHLATGQEIAELVDKLTGERLRARRTELDRRSSGVVRTSERPGARDAARIDAGPLASTDAPLEVAEIEDEPEAEWTVGVHDRATVESPLFADAPPPPAAPAPPRAAPVRPAPPRAVPPTPLPRGRTGTVRLSDVQTHPLYRATPLSTEIQLPPAVATKPRPMRRTLDWEPFYEVAKRDLPYRERLRGYAAIAKQRLEADRFEEFCAKHLAHLDEVVWDFFATPIARDAVRQKVAALFPAHEVEAFTELFWGRIGAWRQDHQPGRA